MSTPKVLTDWDKEMIVKINLKAYFYYIIQTARGKCAGDRVNSD
mgnify:CR=1